MQHLIKIDRLLWAGFGHAKCYIFYKPLSLSGKPAATKVT
jgi:hypothetical protein